MESIFNFCDVFLASFPLLSEHENSFKRIWLILVLLILPLQYKFQTKMSKCLLSSVVCRYLLEFISTLEIDKRCTWKQPWWPPPVPPPSHPSLPSTGPLITINSDDLWRFINEVDLNFEAPSYKSFHDIPNFTTEPRFYTQFSPPKIPTKIHISSTYFCFNFEKLWNTLVDVITFPSFCLQ